MKHMRVFDNGMTAVTENAGVMYVGAAEVETIEIDDLDEKQIAELRAKHERKQQGRRTQKPI